jgi:hypothetical protein
MDAFEKTLAWIAALAVPGGLAYAAVLSNSAGSNNPCNLESPSSGTYLGQTGTFGTANLAQFQTLMLGCAASAGNARALNSQNPGSSYYQLAQLWASGSLNGDNDYGNSVVQAMGVDQSETPSAAFLPWELFAFLNGIVSAEGSEAVNPVTMMEGVLLGYF